MFRSFPALLVAGVLATAANAQQYVHQVVLLNEGWFDYVNQVVVLPPSLGSYDPATGQYTEVAVIPNARFGNDVKVEDEIVFVSADTMLLKYDANTFALLDMEVVRGIRRIGIWNDQLVITRGEFGGLPHYVEVRDKGSLDLLYTIDAAEIPYHAEAVEIVGDQAFVSLPNGFDWPNYMNLVAVIDLASQSYEGVIDLGPDGDNPEHLMSWNGGLYAFNNKDYTGSSISRIDPVASALISTINVANNSGCGTSAAAADKIYYLEYAVDQIARYDLVNDQVQDTLTNGLSAYGIASDPINGVLYVTTTDFTSTGTLYVMEPDGNVLSDEAVGVSAGKMALDIRLTTGVSHAVAPVLTVFPNPAEDRVFIGLPGMASPMGLEVVDAMGRAVLRERLSSNGTLQLDVSSLAPGSYAVKLEGGSYSRFTKQ
ncbi:MAG: T9SS type A sorting domain-containing protein [Flavobacteriales bacterium]|jgi:hypothetical protein|nr:T9SS type A sorting domain-containing protein [Flavobacteriales bacterium]